MTAEPTEETYSDAALATMIETYPLVDARGEEPLIESETTPGTLEANPDWVATYDLAAAAADIWAEKAGALAADYDYQAGGGRFDRSQAYEQAMKQSRFYRARRSPSTVTLVPVPLQQGSEDIEE